MSSKIAVIGGNKPGTANVQVILREAQTCADEIGATKCIVLLLNESDDCYDRMWLNAGLTLSESVALLEITKYGILGTMHNQEDGG